MRFRFHIAEFDLGFFEVPVDSQDGLQALGLVKKRPELCFR